MISLFLLMIFTTEATCDYYVWLAQRRDQDVRAHDSLWHRYKFIMWSLVFGFIFLLTWQPFIPIAAVIFRLFTMQVIYNSIRGIKIKHLGKGPVDRFCRMALGLTGTLYLKVILVLTTIAYEITQYEQLSKKIILGLLSHN